MPSYVVTGAARGIGFEFVHQLSKKQENIVFALVRNKKTATNLQKLVRSNVHILEADITDFKALKKAADNVSDITGGKLDVLINNAAYIEDVRRKYTLDGYPEGDEKVLEEDLRKHFDVNVIGVIHTINVFLLLLKAGQAKKVFTLSTGLADLDLTLLSEFAVGVPYSISKAALNMVVAKYAVEYKSEGFTFLAVSPGLVNTSAKAPSPEEIEQYLGMVASFKKFAPHFEGAITPEESVVMMLRVLDKANVADTGAFISHKGNKEWL